MARETRREARARITAEIMDAARRQLVEVGAAGLSVREVAREVGMVSSAVYRYVESRDDLLTRLIIGAYDALGLAAESASAAARSQAPGDDLGRWAATAGAVRAWALDHPQQYLLLYGSPVPGYAAPDDTVTPGTRVTFALVDILTDAAAHGRLAAAGPPPLPGDTPLADDLRRLADEIGTALEPTTVLAFVTAWTQLFGLVSFELTSQTRNVVADHDSLFDATSRRLGYQLGLREGTV